MWIDKDGKKWFQGNLHAHSTRSDGQRTYEAVVQTYKDAGYDFLAITDHWIWSTDPQKGLEEMIGDSLMLLPGCEYDVGSSVQEGIYHIVAIGCEGIPDLTRRGADLTAQKIIDEVHKHQGFAILAHPSWSLNRVDEVLKIRDIDATEIYNTTSGLPHNVRPYSGDFVDMMASCGYLLPLVAGDDCHWYDGDETRSAVMVQADECTPQAILVALKAGRCYGTQGPQATVTVEDGIYKVYCTPASCVAFYSDAVWMDDRSVQGEGLTYAEHKIMAHEHFVRAEITDEDGNVCWTMPLPVNQ